MDQGQYIADVIRDGSGGHIARVLLDRAGDRVEVWRQELYSPDKAAAEAADSCRKLEATRDGFRWDERVYVTEAGVGAGIDDSLEEMRAQMAVLRECCPELADWGDLALSSAFGCYSEGCLAISWADWIIERRAFSDFLGYVFGVQVGLIDRDTSCALAERPAEQLGAVRPWKN
ncbi:MAG: hypothetical protein F8N15_10555 [Methanobacterium sp.]|nr:hypothetical protein [Methanobacterium sp.]